MKVGFHTADITPAIGMEMPGGYGKAYIQRIHDPLKVRAMVMEEDDTLVAIVSLDTCFIQSKRIIERIRASVEQQWGIPQDHILIATSHTHSGGPLAGLLPEEFEDAPQLVKNLLLNHSPIANPLYCDWVIQQTVTAIGEASLKREEATLSVGKGLEDKVAFNRRFKMKTGRVYTHPGKGNPDILEPAGPIDPEVGVLSAWNSQGHLLGCVVNYACHATTFSGGVSADWIYYLEQTIQGVMGQKAVVVFLNGASGDVTQVDNYSLRPPEFGEKWARLVGTRIGAEAIKVMVTAEKAPLQPLKVKQKTLCLDRRPPSQERLERSRKIVAEGLQTGKKDTAWTFAKEILILEYLLQREPKVEVEIQAIQVGPALFLANPAEYFCEMGLEIKRSSPFPFTFIVELANGCVGYTPPESAFLPSGGGYETVLTSYSNLEIGSAEKIKEVSLELAHSLTPGAIPEPPRLQEPQRPWEYGLLGPDRE